MSQKQMERRRFGRELMEQEFFFSLTDCFNLELTSEAICKIFSKIPSTGDQPLCDLHLHSATQAGKPCGYIFVPQVGFKPAVLVFERRKPVHAPSRETLWSPRNVPTTVNPGKEFPRVVLPLLLPFLPALALLSPFFHLYGWITRFALEGNGSSAPNSSYPQHPSEFLRYWWATWPPSRHEYITTAISTQTSTNYIQKDHECQEHDR
jgi:hypothetical protein